MHVKDKKKKVGGEGVLTELSKWKLIIFIKWPDDSYRRPNYPYHISVTPLQSLSANRRTLNSHAGKKKIELNLFCPISGRTDRLPH